MMCVRFGFLGVLENARKPENAIFIQTFRAGLQKYLKKYQYSNAVTNDLWEALGEASGLNVKEVNSFGYFAFQNLSLQLMGSWTQKMGFPVVTASYDTASKTLTLSQKRFLADGSDGEFVWSYCVNAINWRNAPS